jgi:lambda repressor-like predicted transcriptional regulator
MTRHRLPIDPVLVPSGRRGGGAGEPASQPVPPALGPTETPIEPVEANGHRQSPFRMGAGGLVVVIVPASLRVECGRRGWSLTQLATRAGISYPTLKSTLRGDAIRPRTVWKIARALHQGDAPPELDQLLGAT